MKIKLLLLSIIFLFSACLANPYGVDTQEKMKNHIYLDASGHSPSLSSALNQVASGGVIELGVGTYDFLTNDTIPACTIKGAGENASIIDIIGNVFLGGDVVLQDLQLYSSDNIWVQDLDYNITADKVKIVTPKIFLGNDTTYWNDCQFDIGVEANGCLVGTASGATAYASFKNCRWGYPEQTGYNGIDQRSGRIELDHCSFWTDSIAIHWAGNVACTTKVIDSYAKTFADYAAVAGGGSSHLIFINSTAESSGATYEAMGWHGTGTAELYQPTVINNNATSPIALKARSDGDAEIHGGYFKGIIKVPGDSSGIVKIYGVPSIDADPPNGKKIFDDYNKVRKNYGKLTIPNTIYGDTLLVANGDLLSVSSHSLALVTGDAAPFTLNGLAIADCRDDTLIISRYQVTGDVTFNWLVIDDGE